MNLCYIKNSFNQIDLLKLFVKSHINIVKIESIEDLKNDDLLIISNEYSNYKEIIKNISNIIVWEDIFREFYNYSFNKYMLNYDFYFLKYSLERALDPNVESIVIGSSYARFGIEENIINDTCVNLSLASQDIYYACLIGKYIISRNTNIKKIFIGTGYYSFHSDLSLSKSSELMRISDVYYPIFKDKHNCIDLPESSNNIFCDNEIFDVKKIVDIFSNNFFIQFKNNYFINIRDRINLRINLKGAENLEWFEINDNMKKEFSYERTQYHNRVIKYINSYVENKEILNSFVKYCNDRGVEVCIIAFPSTQFYKEYLLKEYKELYMDALNSIDGVIHFIDFNEIDIFTDEDFVDMDHLDKSGAIKVSKIINNLNI